MDEAGDVITGKMEVALLLDADRATGVGGVEMGIEGWNNEMVVFEKAEEVKLKPGQTA
jgi:hypothetical protein